MAEPGAQRHLRSHRLLDRRDFLRVQNAGLRFSSEHLVALAAPAAQAHSRVGLTVSTKVGNAVVRNRVRRRLRELVRKGRAGLPQKIDLVLVAKSAAAKAGYGELARSFDSVVKQLGRRFS